MTEKVRIIYFITSLESGGTERQLALLLESLPSAKYEKHVVCLSGLGPLAERFRACTTSISDLKYPRLRRNGKLIWKNLPSTVLSVLRLHRTLRRLRPDILHTLIPVCNVMGSIAGKLARVPVIVCSRLSLGNYRDTNRLFAQLENFTDRFFVLIHCKSIGIKDDVVRREPVDPDDLKVIYNGINAEKYGQPFHKDPLRKELRLEPDSPVIGMVANLRPYKGHADMIEAMPAVLRRHPRVRFLFIGRDDGIQAQLRTRAAELGVDSAITWAGERNDVPKLLQLMNLLVSASHEEGFSNTILEAMASALPVIATHVGGNIEQVADGITGILVPPSSPESLANAMIAILDDPPYGEKMGRHGYRRITHNFSQTAIAQQMEEFYQEAIALSS